jgi:geranylgeranyl diphosphate synthase, type II
MSNDATPTAAETLKARVQSRLQELWPDQEPRSLYEPMRYAMSGGGKMLRPVLLLMSCQAVSGSVDKAMPAAIALELVHNFTLVHDDIMDHDAMRRGRETVYKKWDSNTAILVGDALLVQAYASLAQLEPDLAGRVVDEFSRGILEVCEGQMLDKEFEMRARVSMAEYYTMIAKKTGRLFALACEMGGVLGRGNKQQVQGLEGFGALLGRAFQIQDDVLDLLSDEKVLGKDIGSDLRENKKSFLMVHLQQHGSEKCKSALAYISHRENLTGSDISQAIELLRQDGTLAAAEEEIAHCTREAEAALQTLPDQEARRQLVALLTTLARRKF